MTRRMRVARVLFGIWAMGLIPACSTLKQPFYVECKGKGQITGTGQANAGSGIMGGGTNAFTLQADCGDGFIIQRLDAPPPVTPAKPAEPAAPPLTKL